jgi:hypothetical protein
MHSPEQQAAFLMMRANGWSLTKISQKLNVSRSTLFRWEDSQRKEIHFMRALQMEALQEKYIPPVEDELQQLRGYLGAIERALQKHDFAQSRPEFLLRSALQLRSRLGRLRCDVSLHEPIERHGLEPLPVSLSGCLSHSDSLIKPHADETPSAPEVEPADSAVPQSPAAPEENGTKRNKIDCAENLEASASTPCNDRHGTVVPFSALPPRDGCPPSSPGAHGDNARSSEFIVVTESGAASASSSNASAPPKPAWNSNRASRRP